MAGKPPRTENLTGTCWRDDVWMHSHGLLSHATVIDYFALSPFYDRTSNNEAARQRGLKLEQLGEAPGTEFVLQDAQPPHLFVIRKQFRSVSGAITTAAYYYVLDGTIYQAPTLHAALCCRVERCMYTLHSAIEELRSDLDPLGQVGRETKDALIQSAILSHTSTPSSAISLERNTEQQQRSERMLLSALLNHPLPLATYVLKQQQEQKEGEEEEVGKQVGDTGTMGHHGGVHSTVLSGQASVGR